MLCSWHGVRIRCGLDGTMNGLQASAFALPMFDPMEEAMLLAFHIGYEQDAQRAPVLDAVGTVRELETELFECLMVAT